MSMSAQADKEFQDEAARVNTLSWLSCSYRALILVCIFQLFVQIGLVVWIANQCTSVLGISLSGRLFQTDMLTCPTPGVAKLFPHR